MRLSLLLISLLACSLLPMPVHSQEKQKLPAGCYVYLGKQPGSSPPKYVYVGEDGSLRWENSGAGTVKSESSNSTGKEPNKKSEPSGKGEFESYDYPFIKWKPKMLPGGALIQLETTVSNKGMQHGFYGQVKYKAFVFVKGNSLVPSNGIRVKFLDNRGFSVGTFQVNSRDLGVVTGTSVMEGQGTVNMSEEDYKQAVDYSVN